MNNTNMLQNHDKNAHSWNWKKTKPPIAAKRFFKPNRLDRKKSTEVKLDKNTMKNMTGHVSGELTIIGHVSDTKSNLREVKSLRRPKLPNLKSFNTEKQIKRELENFSEKKSPGSSQFDFYLTHFCNTDYIASLEKEERDQSPLFFTKPKVRDNIDDEILTTARKIKQHKQNFNKVKPLLLSEISHSRKLQNYRQMEEVFKKNESHFRVNNKVEEINYRQMMEIKLYAQNMIYKKLFDEFSSDLVRQKKEAQLINIVRNNEKRVLKLKKNNIQELRKVTQFVGDRLEKQKLKVQELIEEFRDKFDISDKEKQAILDSFNSNY